MYILSTLRIVFELGRKLLEIGNKDNLGKSNSNTLEKTNGKKQKQKQKKRKI